MENRLSFGQLKFVQNYLMNVLCICPRLYISVLNLKQKQETLVYQYVENTVLFITFI